VGAITQVTEQQYWGFEVVVEQSSYQILIFLHQDDEINDIDDSDDDDHDDNSGGLSSCYENLG
jgi:hypothetical protein